MAQCRSCGARVLWVETKNKKWMMIEYDKDVADRISDPVTPVYFDPDKMISHFANCPNADKHRRPVGRN